MATDYTNVPLVKAHLGIDDGDSDGLIQAAVTAASRAIDRYTGAQFYPSTETRLFYGQPDGGIWVDPFTDTTGLLVETGSLGTYTTEIVDTDYVLWPMNAPEKGMAYRRIFTGYSWTNRWRRGTRHPDVQITARWGYATVPVDVEMACRIKAAHLFRRMDTPDGTAGTSEFGVVRISRFEDPDVAMLLGNFTGPSSR